MHFNTVNRTHLNLGFDPIKESHKGLSELINDEVLQQQQQMSNNSNGQRSRMPPPPGFNHIQSSFSNYGAAAASPRTQSELKYMLFKNNIILRCIHIKKALP